MRKFFFKMYAFFFGLFICIGLQLGFAAIYYTQASNKLLVIKKQQISMISALQCLDTYGMFNVALEMLIMHNGTTKIKNQPVVTELRYALDQLSDITAFQNSLTDENGNLPLYQQRILYNISCYDANTHLNAWNSSTTAGECLYISNGLTYTGLVKIFTQTELNIDQFIQKYNTSSKSQTELEEMYREIWNRVSSYASTGNVLILLSFLYSTDSFDSLVEELGEKSVLLAWIAGVVCIILGVATWLFGIRKLSRISFERNLMLNLLPKKIISNNFLLKKYVNQLD